MRNLCGVWVLVGLWPLVGCGTVIQPGHRGLVFNSRSGGLARDVLFPGYHRHGVYGRIEDFDITYSTRKEQITTASSQGLSVDFALAVIFRPIESELYQLETEIGPSYYDEVIGPEFRSAARGVLARHSFLELQAHNAIIEDEIEDELRKRIAGKHVEISSVTMEGIRYAPEITASIRDKLVGEQEALRRKTAVEAEALREELSLKHEAEKARLRAEQEVEAKKHQREVAEQQAAIDRVQAQAAAEVQLTRARAQAEEETLLAKAHLAEQRAQHTTLTPLSVMDHAYEALGKLAGGGTTVLLGDWSKVPSFLFPASLLSAAAAGRAAAAAPVAAAPDGLEPPSEPHVERRGRLQNFPVTPRRP
jgi:regulator of protease activity HflC (stomatin/prohibitin superfamily)